MNGFLQANKAFSGTLALLTTGGNSIMGDSNGSVGLAGTYATGATNSPADAINILSLAIRPAASAASSVINGENLLLMGAG